MTDADALTRAELVAVVVAVTAGVPLVLTTPGAPARLPSGPLANAHRSMQAGTRSWVESQTGLKLGYLEQLYTFADRDRVDQAGHQSISVSYLALTRRDAAATQWLDWYSLFPWEDRRRSDQLAAGLLTPLRAWATQQPTARESRCANAFGLDGRPWQPELALPRYEILYEAGLIGESRSGTALPTELIGPAMLNDHRRILATGIARLRAKIQYRPVVFELMPDAFTLGQLQTAVEAIAGQPVHKQNFRRLVEQQELVEPTGERSAVTGGRPAMLYRFRRQVIEDRAFTGTKLPRVSAG